MSLKKALLEEALKGEFKVNIYCDTDIEAFSRCLIKEITDEEIRFITTKTVFDPSDNNVVSLILEVVLDRTRITGVSKVIASLTVESDEGEDDGIFI